MRIEEVDARDRSVRATSGSTGKVVDRHRQHPGARRGDRAPAPRGSAPPASCCGRPRRASAVRGDAEPSSARGRVRARRPRRPRRCRRDRARLRGALRAPRRAASTRRVSSTPRDARRHERRARGTACSRSTPARRSCSRRTAARLMRRDRQRRQHRQHHHHGQPRRRAGRCTRRTRRRKGALGDLHRATPATRCSPIASGSTGLNIGWTRDRGRARRADRRGHGRRLARARPTPAPARRACCRPDDIAADGHLPPARSRAACRTTRDWTPARPRPRSASSCRTSTRCSRACAPSCTNTPGAPYDRTVRPHHDGPRRRRPVPRADRRPAGRRPHASPSRSAAARPTSPSPRRGWANAQRRHHEGRRRPVRPLHPPGAARVRRRRRAASGPHPTLRTPVVVLRDPPARRLPAALLPRADRARHDARRRTSSTSTRSARRACSGRPAPGCRPSPAGGDAGRARGARRGACPTRSPIHDLDHRPHVPGPADESEAGDVGARGAGARDGRRRQPRRGRGRGRHARPARGVGRAARARRRARDRQAGSGTGCSSARPTARRGARR